MMNQEQNPELVNFMGFADEMEVDEEVHGAKALYEEHLSFDEMVLGIKEGRYFQARMNVSRVNAKEASVLIQGMT